MIRQLPILLRREVWENKGIFLILPAIGTALAVVLVVASTFFAEVRIDVAGDIEIHGDADRYEWQMTETEGRALKDVYVDHLRDMERMDASDREMRLARILRIISIPFQLELFFVVMFYLLWSLYQERKDRSVLFWKSLPVSDTATVVSKLIAGTIVAPCVAWLFILVTQIVVLLTASIVAAGAEIAVWSTIWQPAQLFSNSSLLLVIFLVQVLWSLPFYGWLMLVSSYARSVPLAWAVGIPVAIMIVEAVMMPGKIFVTAFMDHLKVLGVGDDFDIVVRSWADLPGLLGSIDIWVGAAVGAVFLVGAIRFRGMTDEI